MAWFDVPDDPARTAPPNDPPAEITCDKCGADIWGNYYKFEDFIYCPDCVAAMTRDSKRNAPEFMKMLMLDALDEWRVIV